MYLEARAAGTQGAPFILISLYNIIYMYMYTGKREGHCLWSKTEIKLYLVLMKGGLLSNNPI